MELTIITINLFIFLISNYYILKNFGVPESLSETTYLLKSKYWLFTLLCVFISFSLMPLWLNIYDNNQFEFLKFFALSSLLFVGSTPFFKESIQKTIHYSSAIMCFLSVILWFISQNLFLYIILFFILMICGLCLFNKKKYVYIAEISLWFIILLFLTQEYA